jgi:p-hydroxybenzoate 3-monooxygenase
MHAEGLPHDGFDMVYAGQRRRIDLFGLTGKRVMVYGQTEVTRDLMDHRAAIGRPTVYEAENVRIHGWDGDKPWVTYTKDGVEQRLDCDFIAGCDGFHGVCRASVPSRAITNHEKVYPFGWLGLLADVPPVHHELIYGHTERGFMLASMRSHTRVRYYIQCGLHEKVEDWSDEAFYDEFRKRLPPEDAARLITGASIEKSIAPLRSFVAEPLRFGRKGLNLAASDVALLSRGIVEHYAERSQAGIDHYSQRALARIWKAERFSWWFTQLMHLFPENGSFGLKMQMAELDYLFSSESAQRVVAENYVGLPIG